MNDKSKIQLANTILDFLAVNKEDTKDVPRMIGTLTKAWGMNGFKKAEPGTPVFQKGDRYAIYLESLDGKTSVEVPFMKETLAPVIDFTKLAL